MREILFRGKQINTESQMWKYGDLLHNGYDYKYAIRDKKDSGVYEVIPETIGQYTGLTDENGTKIFEGDIVKVQDDLTLSPFCDGIVGVVEYDEACFFLAPEKVENSQGLYNECAFYEVLGNIYDNPELLKGGQNNEKA